MKSLFIGALALSSLMSGAAIADTISVQYFQVPDGAGLDFNICCSSAPSATLPNVALGSSLSDGLPVTTIGGQYDPVMVNPITPTTGQILWWTPSGTTGITSEGTATVSMPFADNKFYAPTGAGPNNSNFFQTAILTGTILGTGADVKLTVSSDDDALVYLNGLFVGGNPGVHDVVTNTIDLGNVGPDALLQVFYADRAQTGAVLDLTLTGAAIAASVPEPSTWAMMVLGFFGVGFLAYRRKQNGPAFRIA